jgi:hypothetical protein
MRSLNAACTKNTGLLDAAAKRACEQSADMGKPEVIRYRVELWLLVQVHDHILARIATDRI